MHTRDGVMQTSASPQPAASFFTKAVSVISYTASSILGPLTLKFTFNKATLHHVEEDCDHDVQELTLLCHMSSQLLIAEQLHTNMYNAVGHGVRLVALHQRFHDECIMLNKCFCKSDLTERKKKKAHHN